MNIYKPPVANLADERGIDGKTCPECRRHISWIVAYFKPSMINVCTCPHCKTQLKYNIETPPVYFFVFVTFVYMIGLLIYLDQYTLMSEQAVLWTYVLVGIVPPTFIAIGLTVYCRHYKKLIRLSAVD